MKIAGTLCLFMVSFISFSQNGGGDTRSQFKYQIKRSASPIILDGTIGANEWDNHIPIGNFYNHWPEDTGQAQNQTEVKLTYDDQNLYVLAKCFDDGKRIVQSLVRDGDEDYWGSDNFSLVMDPVNTKQSGFFLGLPREEQKQRVALLLRGHSPMYPRIGTTNGHQKQRNTKIIGW